MQVATLVLICRCGQVLMGVKNKGEIGIGILSAPGGKKEATESLIECALREVVEEAAIELRPEELKIVACVDTFAGDVHDFRVYVYRAEITEVVGYIVTADMHPYWYLIDQLPYELMYDGDKVWFSQACTTDDPFAVKLYYARCAEHCLRHEFVPYPPVD